MFLGSLYINIGYVNASTTLNPDIQSGLASLGLSKISQVGLLHVSVGGSSNKHLDNLDFLPNLKVLMLSTSCILEACQLTEFAASLLTFLSNCIVCIGGSEPCGLAHSRLARSAQTFISGLVGVLLQNC